MSSEYEVYCVCGRPKLPCGHCPASPPKTPCTCTQAYRLYEMKSYGFEYRSLPMSVDLYRVAEALENLSRERWTEKT
jgi:hypothetical protein